MVSTYTYLPTLPATILSVHLNAEHHTNPHQLADSIPLSNFLKIKQGPRSLSFRNISISPCKHQAQIFCQTGRVGSQQYI